jgi:hypothetical protein
VIPLVFIFTGCKGDTGAAGSGATGAPGSFATTGCIGCHHIDNKTLASSLLAPAYGAGSVTTAPTGTAGTAISLTAKSSFTPTGSTAAVNAVGYFWSQVGGLPVTFNSVVSGPTVTFTINDPPDYLGALLAATVIPDRTMIVPVNSLMIEEASNAEIMVMFFGSDGKIYYDVVLVKEPGAAAALANIAPRETTGLNNVAINTAVLLNAQGTHSLSLTPPSGSSAALAGTTKNPHFTPDVVGQYIVTDNITSANSFIVFAGIWRGEITGIESVTAAGIVPRPDPVCTNVACHSATGAATDNFTPWKTSGHAGIFSQNLNAGGHYSSSCFSCHTVGFKAGVASLAAQDNGFDSQPNYAQFIADTSFFSPATDNTRYSRMWSSATYSALAVETNIQCENCHGPQNIDTGKTLSSFSAAHDTTINGAGPRVSVAAEVCGSCHGEPTRHGRFQQWQESPSGHANYSLASSHASASCAACHTAQGNIAWIKQLVAGNPLRVLPASFSIPANQVQPQTCAVCHDPHAEGTTTTSGPAYSDAAVQTNAQPRLAALMVAAGLSAGDTPKLPTGFAAKGVGKGAECMLCHNIREGGIGTTAADGSLVPDASGFGGSYLHEDNSVVFGLGPIGAVSLPTLTWSTGYVSPHDFAQADVLMGHNAYFMGDSGGDNSIYKSPHANIVDTCVTCHMEKTPPPALLSYAYGGSNHTFKASMEICVDCHGIDSGLGLKLQADTQALLDQTASDIATYIKTRASGTLVGIVTAPSTTVTLNIPFQGSIYSISQAKSTGLGAPSITSWDITLRSPTGVTIPDISSTTTPTVVIQVGGAPDTTTVGASGNTMITTNPGNPGTITITSLNIRYLVPLTADQRSDFVLNKSTWNYLLILRDYSLGVHNPAFARDVLTRTSAELSKHLDDK